MRSVKYHKQMQTLSVAVFIDNYIQIYDDDNHDTELKLIYQQQVTIL